MKKKHEGFILLESLTGFAISLMIILTLSYCVNEQFKLLSQWEEQVNADKIILMHLKSKEIPNVLIIKGKEYSFTNTSNSYQVEANKNVYQIKK
ncbi:hypothetical protein [Companilactobacillus muriivasis]|uniref:hypothetical protein n=1 Tax=Companilactobacillus muriivasis TaxID=3081444 RepID=UPI0030C777EC